MNIQLKNELTDTDLLIVPSFEDEEIKTLKQIINKSELINTLSSDFKNTPGSTTLIYSEGSAKRILVLGLGPKKTFTTAIWRKALQTACLNAQRMELENISLLFPASKSADARFLETAGFAIAFGAYRFTEYKTEHRSKTAEQFTVIVSKLNSGTKKAFETGVLIGKACNNARSLANHPGNFATPTHLADHAQAIAKESGFKCRVLGPKEIEQEGLGLLTAVAAGSEQPPRFIILEYGNPKKDPIVLIGKGLTFDSGGVSIKPADRMDEMKFDMAGGATVIGIFEAVAKLKLPVNLVGLIPSSENLISGKALKPGDIIKSHSGKTVEVLNTDAEGRLILADAISFAKKYYKPKFMIDYATLTGAVIHALGDEYTGYLSNTKTLDTAFNYASSQTGEKFWALPLANEYKDQLRSQTADIKNIGDKGFAGTINGALFLESFVGNTPWVHLDIAGTAWSTRYKGHLPPGSSGWGVYLTVNMLRSLRSSKKS